MKKNTIVKAGKLIIMALLVQTALCGCGKVEETNTEEASANTFTYWCDMPASATSVYDSLNDMTMYKKMEEVTGVKVQFMHPAAGQTQEQFNLMLASGELPDVIEWNWNAYLGGPAKAIEDGIIQPLDDYLDLMPNFKKLIESNKDYEIPSKTDDGQYYGFPTVNTGSQRVFGGIMLRQDWLDDLGLSVPETIDEWENVLLAFKEKKGATAAFTADVSMFSSAGTHSFNSGFDVGRGLYLDNGVVKYAPIEDAHKEWIKRMNKWYEMGILDCDFATNNQSIINAKMTNGASGAVSGSIGAQMGTFMNIMKDDPKYQLVAAPYPVKEKGQPARFINMEYDVQPPVLTITKNCKNPEVVAKWADYWYGEEGYMLMNFGVEGITYNMVDGKPVYTDLILHNPEGLSISDAMCRHMRASYPSPGQKQAPEYLQQYYQFDCQKEALKIWSQYQEEGKKTKMPMLSPNPEEIDEMATLQTEIETYTDEMIIKFVQGTEDIEKYDEFVAELKKLNVDRYIEIKQQEYDRYIKR